MGAREVWVRAWFGAVRCGRCDLVWAGARRDEWFGLERGLVGRGFGAVRCGRCDLVRAGARRDEWFGLERGLTLTRG